MSCPLGFNNSYAIGMLNAQAERLQIDKISALRRHPELHLGFNNEFMDRRDGWRGLRLHYGLPQEQVLGLDHESAVALGLPPRRRLLWIELPLASRSILAGIKTAAVINVGFATLGALIGAGGYGQPILTGIRLADTGLILQGAIPAAVLALLVQGLFELAERQLIPRGLRLKPDS